MVGISLAGNLVASCEEPGVLETPAGELKVCFFIDEHPEPPGLAFDLRSFAFTLNHEGSEPIYGALIAARMSASDPITLDDDAFREAMAILANLRPR
jgi:hypothetical protein